VDHYSLIFLGGRAGGRRGHDLFYLSVCVDFLGLLSVPKLATVATDSAFAYSMCTCTRTYVCSVDAHGSTNE